MAKIIVFGNEKSSEVKNKLIEEGLGAILVKIILDKESEYYLKEDGVLRQLRRGTLGTGVKTKHNKGSIVLDQSSLTVLCHLSMM